MNDFSGFFPVQSTVSNVGHVCDALSIPSGEHELFCLLLGVFGDNKEWRRCVFQGLEFVFKRLSHHVSERGEFFN